MDYKNIALKIIDDVGGKGNVISLSHCYTRLRFSLKDEGKVKTNEIKKLDGILQVIVSSGEYQIIIGPEVNGVFKAIKTNNLLSEGQINDGTAVEQQSQEEQNKSFKNKNLKYYLSRCLDTFVNCFTPIIPVIAGAGMVKVLIAILESIHILSTNSSTFVVLNAIGNGVYYFLPFFVAITTAKVLKADTFMSLAVAASIMYPQLSQIAAKGPKIITFLNLPMQIIDYSSQALPIIFAVLVVKYVDKFSDKITPNLIKTFIRPMITLLISIPIVLCIFGPIAAWLGDQFTKLTALMNQWGWIAVGLNAAVFPFLVLTGTHNAVIPLMIQMFATQGFDAILVPSGLAANIAESGAAAAVSFKTKNKKMKSTALGATVSALFGITEPALYGVNLKLKRPFIGMLLGSLVGGSFAGMIHLVAYSFVSPSILSLPIFIGKDSNLITAFLAVLVTFIATFIITWLLGFKENTYFENNVKTKKNTIAEVNTGKIFVNMQIPISGNIISLKKVPDKAFANGDLGKGFAVEPNGSGKVYSPVDGTVVAVFPTKHALGLKTKDGLEIMIHMGVDTVNLKGKYFKNYVKVGSKIKKGDLLAQLNLIKVKEAGYNTDIITVITNTAKYTNVTITPSRDKKEVGVNIEV